ncbi:MAG: ferrous iron transport protein B [Chloroflexi bacterium]|nr:ferrous iron transport protein B [Chloroflexota bacterium]
MERDYTIALAGNPNCGKSTVFNQLTGTRQHVGNWPGKTVEKKEGTFQNKEQKIRVVDLPGTYSLTAYSLEEMIARDYIVKEKPDLVVSIVDAANIERNLYLTMQLIELGVPVLLALNMMDVVDEREIQIDMQKIASSLEVPVVQMVARDGKGVDELRETILKLARNSAPYQKKVPAQFNTELEMQIKKLQGKIAQLPALQGAFDSRWLAIKLLEGDKGVLHDFEQNPVYAPLLEEVRVFTSFYAEKAEMDIDTQIADAYYTAIHEITCSAVKKPSGRKENFSDKVDRIVTHRIFGIPIFLALMWVVFKLTSDVSAPFLDWVDGAIGGPITNWLVSILSLLGLNGSWFESLLVNGVIAGVGSVLVFVPVLMMLYLALAVLEDSGYMARAAFVMDRLMNGLGLHGKSFLPMIVGFGCTVPAIYATRTLENEKDRILTSLLVPFMSCGARLPVYVLFASVFFPENTGLVIFSLYVIGIVMAILVGLLLKNTIFKSGTTSPFVMELPPYRRPTFKSIWAQMSERTNAFVKKAWSLILVTSICIWVLLALPVRGEGTFADAPVADSAFAGVSSVVAPIFQPAGFGTWEASGALLTGFVAKEVVVSTMSQIYDVEETAEVGESTTFLQDIWSLVSSFFTAAWDTIKSIPLIVGVNLFAEEEEPQPTALMSAVHTGFDASSAGKGALASFAFMLFVLLYTPCMVAVAAERHEFGAKWMWVSVIGQFVLAWIVAVLVFQIGSLF